MANTGIAVSLQKFIASLDQSCLPRILHVCSGVYFAGSVYELSGSEVCLSTGDVIKVIGFEPVSVSCEDVSTNEKFELPLNHTGLFKLVPEEMPYGSVEEMVSMRPVGLDSCLPFSFRSRAEMTFQSFVLGGGRALTMLSLEGGGTEGAEPSRERSVRCRLRGEQGAAAEVLVPLSCRGEFYECESDHGYTVQEVLSSPELQTRRFSRTTMSPGPLVLCPVYQVQAVMHLRKNIVKFPSTLEVDVVDVTAQSGDMAFVTPLTLSEVHAQPDAAFPTVAEILEGPETTTQQGGAMFLCSWLPELRTGRRLVLHGRGATPMVLASSPRGGGRRRAQRYFLVSAAGYGGRLRRRPREFCSVYELYAAWARAAPAGAGGGLKVSVTRRCEEEGGGAELEGGDQLEVLRMEKTEVMDGGGGGGGGRRRTVDALLCRRPREKEEEEEEEESEEVLLPLFMQGSFVEKITDKKKYSMADLCESSSLPLEVKVVTRDAALEADPLAGFSSLRLEGAALEPVVLASLPSRPERRFHIPVRWLRMSVSFTQDPLPGPAPEPPHRLETVTEVTGAFYYEFCKTTGSDEPAPPRPPKREPESDSLEKTRSKATSINQSTNQTRSVPTSPCRERKSKTLTNETRRLSLHNKPKRPPAPQAPAESEQSPPPLRPRKPTATGPRKPTATVKAEPNTYVKVDGGRKQADLCHITADVDSDHDYESVDEMVDMLKKAQESVLFY